MLDLVAPDSGIVDRLMVLCRIGLQRLDHDRDVTRILLRDNTAPQDALEVARRDEHLVVLSVLSRGLAELAGPDRGDEDWDAVAVVLQSSLAHYWLVRDLFGGEHPSDHRHRPILAGDRRDGRCTPQSTCRRSSSNLGQLDAAG